MASYEYKLPIEQWRQVLMNNSPGELCNVVLVSRHMNNVASLPELWAGMKVNSRKVRENGLLELYNINRFKKVKEINFKSNSIYLNVEEIERMLKEIPGSPLEIGYFGGLEWSELHEVSPEVLASAVSHLRSANFWGTHLTTDQCNFLLIDSLSSTTLTHLNLNYTPLVQVPTELLANSISRLQDVGLRQTGLTTVQCVALLNESLSSATLKHVDLEEVNLSKVPSELLANSISRLHKVNLRKTDLTTDQCVALLEASLASATLTNVNLELVNLSEVPVELLADSISRLRHVNLSTDENLSTDLTTDHYVALLKGILSSATLTNVYLKNLGLDEVPAELLANSISRLQEVNLCRTFIKTDQCVALLKASLSSATLKNLNLKLNDLSEVPADLLADSISRLQHVNLSGTELTTDQCVALLEATITSATLTNVKLNDVNLSEVPAELLANSISRLQDVGLRQTHLTTVQCVALLNESLSSATLKNVNLEEVNLSEVPAELLANSVCRLQHVYLYKTFLTLDQCVELVVKASDSSTKLQLINLRDNEIVKEIARDNVNNLFTTLLERMSVILYEPW